VHIDSLSFPLEGLVANLFIFQVPVAGGSQVSNTWTLLKEKAAHISAQSRPQSVILIEALTLMA